MTIDPSTTALLVIDVLEGGDDDTVYDPAVESFSRACSKVVSTCRKAGIPIICCDDAHRPGSDHEVGLWGEHGMAGTPAAQPASFLGISQGDIIIDKRRYDAFFETDLDITLRELGVKTVLAIGCDTNICVVQTLAGAFYRCYDSIVVSDATRTFLVGTQEGGLEYCRRCFGSTILDSSDLEASIS